MGASRSPLVRGICTATRPFLLALLFAFVATPALAQRGAITAPRNLQQLTDRADLIVRGTITGARVEKHPVYTHLDTVVVTVRVRESLKGKAGETYTFRQYIWDARDKQDAAGYAKGQDMLLLLIAPNAQGLSSPAGLDQGRFRLRRDRLGREFAVNGHGNYRLLDGLATDKTPGGARLSAAHRQFAARHRSGPIEAGRLVALIRELARSAP